MSTVHDRAEAAAAKLTVIEAAARFASRGAGESQMDGNIILGAIVRVVAEVFLDVHWITRAECRVPAPTDDERERTERIKDAGRAHGRFE